MRWMKPWICLLALSRPLQAEQEPDSTCWTALIPDLNRCSPHRGHFTFLGWCTLKTSSSHRHVSMIANYYLHVLLETVVIVHPRILAVKHTTTSRLLTPGNGVVVVSSGAHAWLLLHSLDKTDVIHWHVVLSAQLSLASTHHSGSLYCSGSSWIGFRCILTEQQGSINPICNTC